MTVGHHEYVVRDERGPRDRSEQIQGGVVRDHVLIERHAAAARGRLDRSADPAHQVSLEIRLQDSGARIGDTAPNVEREVVWQQHARAHPQVVSAQRLMK